MARRGARVESSENIAQADDVLGHHGSASLKRDRALDSSGDVHWMHNFNAGEAGESAFIEGENGGKAMHLHGGHQPGVVGWLPGNLILNDQALPNRINRRGVG